MPGEGAFYAPKLEWHLTDAIGRTWQVGTIQSDRVLPERLDASYVGEDGERHRPVMLHRAIFGSYERFIGILIEHYAGKLPVWLAPVQAVVATIVSDADDYAEQVAAELRKAGLRVETDLRNEKINYKVREHSLAKVPNLLVVGKREADEGTVALRQLGSERQQIVSLADAGRTAQVQAALPPDLHLTLRGRLSPSPQKHYIDRPTTTGATSIPPPNMRRPLQAPPMNGPRFNEFIQSPKVRVIDHEGENLGVMYTKEAMEQANELGLDLVEVSPNADPPVAKFLDVGKFKYEAQKKANLARKSQKTQEIKEIKMRPNIDDHDYETKMKAVHKFIGEGDKVKITLRFRGRELSHGQLGMALLKRVQDDTVEDAKIESYPRMEGRQMLMVLSPK